LYEQKIKPILPQFGDCELSPDIIKELTNYFNAFEDAVILNDSTQDKTNYITTMQGPCKKHDCFWASSVLFNVFAGERKVSTGFGGSIISTIFGRRSGASGEKVKIPENILVLLVLTMIQKKLESLVEEYITKLKSFLPALKEKPDVKESHLEIF